MRCGDCERLMEPYLRDELPVDQLEVFLDHVDHCADCREELEIVYMLHEGLHQLQQDEESSFDMTGMLERRLEASRQKVKKTGIFRQVITCLGGAGLLILLMAIIWQLRELFL